MVKKLVYIDNKCLIEKSVDIIINGNIYANQDCYNFTDQNIQFLLGPRYALLREEFRNLPKRIINEFPKKILITTGGNDEFNLTLRLIKILKSDEFTQNIDIRCIIGEMFEDKENLEAYTKQSKNTTLIYNIKNISEEMQMCDLTLTTSGATLYELAITGTPSISFIVAKNQEKIAYYMNRFKCTLNLGWYNKISDTEILKKIKFLLKNYQLRKAMSKDCQEKFDGNGPYRCVYNIMASLNDQ